MSNRAEVVTKWPLDERAKELKSLGSDPTGRLPLVKALGVAWDCETDVFTFESRGLEKEITDVASVLSILASIYDPLGIIAPFLLTGKQIFQDLWHEVDKSWKSSVPTDYRRNWKDWMDQLPIVAKLGIQRWFGFPKGKEVILHVFTDASTKGYGAVAYLQAEGYTPAFAAAKTRVVSPKRRGNIPRLELQAALVGFRLARQILTELADTKFTELVFWSDSSTVLRWLTNQEDRFDHFVGNRVSEIQDIANDLEIPVDMRFVPTDVNPADLASRGAEKGAEAFAERFEFWSHGPDFLRGSRQLWPENLPPKKNSSEKLQKQLEFALPAVASSPEEEFCGDNFTEFLMDKSQQEHPTYDQLLELESELIREAQEMHYSSEIASCKRSPTRTCVRRKGDFARRQIWLDPKGVLRLQTRMFAAEDWPVESALPALLPRQHPLTKLIIRDAHRQVEHQGHTYTWAKLREKYFIFQGKATVKTICFHCSYCRTRRPRPMRPPTAGLHASRLRVDEPAWTETGMDHFGPFYLAKNQKRWGLIFICLTTRAVHIEDVDGLGAEPFCNALDRFISRRRRPKVLRSDQGTAFMSLAKLQEKTCAEYAQELSTEALKRFKVDLHFNPPEAPHWGGSWERMIREIKKILQSTMDSFTGAWRRDEFRTFLVRAEGILNRRPIAFGPDGEIVSPNNFLQPGEDVPIGPPLGAPKITSLVLVKKAEQMFWQRWVKFYLPSISAQQILGEVTNEDLLPGDKVLLREGSNPLVDNWIPATVKEVYPSADGVIRSVMVDTKNGQMVRDITRVAIIDGPVLQRRKALPSPSGGVLVPGRTLRPRNPPIGR